MSSSSYPDLDLSDLLPGDFGLTLGRSQISKLIAWAGDSLYSHAFLVYDTSQLIEAAPAGVRMVPIAERLREPSLLLFDVYRPSSAKGESYNAAEVRAMQIKAREFLGRGYPLNELLQLGLMCALRNKIPQSEPLRWILRIAMDALIRDDSRQMMCSELIYRILRDAESSPNVLTPTIINPTRSHAAMPPIDFAELLREIEALFPKSDAVENAAIHAAYQDKQIPSVAELDAKAQLIRAKFAAPTPTAGAFVVPNPNPKTILPSDLERSPSVRFLARVRRA